MSTRLVVPLAVAVVIAGALLVAVPEREAVAVDPVAAAARAESAVPTLGLSWGRLRGWNRVGDGWTLVWQPAHGAWLVRVWVPDSGDAPTWRLEAASWLPGARLSRTAAAILLRWPGGVATADDRIGRRDWRVGDQRVLGALAAGGSLPALQRRGRWTWPAILAGLLLAGAVVRVVFPAVPTRLSRRAVSTVAAIGVVLLPWCLPLFGPVFTVGVRPWVTQVAVVAVLALLLGAFALAVVGLPAAYRAPRAAPLAFAFAIGVLAGRLRPAPAAVLVEGLTVRLGVALVLIVLGAWLGALAGDGLRWLLGSRRAVRRWLLAGCAVAAILWSGTALGPVLAALAAASVERPDGVWTAGAVLWGWWAMAVLTLCGWTAAGTDGAGLVLAGTAALAILSVGTRGDTRGSADLATPS